MLLSPKISVNIKRKSIICHSSVPQKRKILKGVIKTIIDSNPDCVQNPTTEKCRLVWDTIGDFEIALNKLPKYVDPLEEFCKEYPEADECRVYDV